MNDHEFLCIQPHVSKTLLGPGQTEICTYCIVSLPSLTFNLLYIILLHIIPFIESVTTSSQNKRKQMAKRHQNGNHRGPPSRPSKYHPKALDIHVSSHESPVPVAQSIQHCSKLLGLDEQRAPNVPHAENCCTHDRSWHRAQTRFRQSIPWRNQKGFRRKKWKMLKMIMGNIKLTSNIQWD